MQAPRFRLALRWGVIYVGFCELRLWDLLAWLVISVGITHRNVLSLVGDSWGGSPWVMYPHLGITLGRLGFVGVLYRKCIAYGT